MNQNQIVQECFDGTRFRNCIVCPAHHKKGGTCCFGNRWEDNDKTCYSCQYNAACREETFATLTHRPAQPNPNFRPIAAPYSRPTIPINNSNRPPEPILNQNTMHRHPQERNNQSFAQQLGMHVVWGAIEGALEMMIGFFRARRPF
jgi:hypothetical protein